jgi:large subunit ribosomal protein L15
MHTKRKKRSRIRAAKVTAGHGHKKKNRGAGHRGGRGKAGSGKRGEFKLMKLTQGKKYLGKHGFNKIKKEVKTINLQTIQEKLPSLVNSGKAKIIKDTYEIDLTTLGYDKLLSKGQIDVKLNITITKASNNAISKVEAAGGKVNTVHVLQEKPVVKTQETSEVSSENNEEIKK